MLASLTLHTALWQALHCERIVSDSIVSTIRLAKAADLKFVTVSVAYTAASAAPISGPVAPHINLAPPSVVRSCSQACLHTLVAAWISRPHSLKQTRNCCSRLDLRASGVYPDCVDALYHGLA